MYCYQSFAIIAVLFNTYILIVTLCFVGVKDARTNEWLLAFPADSPCHTSCVLHWLSVCPHAPCFFCVFFSFSSCKIDALACLQISEAGGVVIEWICSNPTTLGVPGNAVDWLGKGVYSICGKKLDLPVTIAQRARGEEGTGEDNDGGGDSDRKGKKGKKRRAGK